MRLVDVAIAVVLVFLGLIALSWWSGRYPPGPAQHELTEDIVESQR